MRSVIEICESNTVDQYEMQFVIQQYIFDKKGVKVDINIRNLRFINDFSMIFQLEMMQKAFEVAAKYYLSK